MKKKSVKKSVKRSAKKAVKKIIRRSAKRIQRKVIKKDYFVFVKKFGSYKFSNKAGRNSFIKEIKKMRLEYIFSL